MANTSNNGTEYYTISCGVPSVSSWNPNSNTGSAYFYRESNDYVIWGSGVTITPVLSNNGSSYYAPISSRATDSGWSPSANNGTKFYYSSAFNFVRFCS